MLLAALLLAVSGALAGETPGAATPDNQSPAGIFGDAFGKVRTWYVDKVDDNVLFRNAIQGVVTAFPILEAQPETKKALSRLDSKGAPNSNSDNIKIFSDFIASARKITNKGDEALLAAAMKGLLEGLDKHSTYNRGSRNGCASKAALGVEVRSENDGVRVVRPLEGSGALEAGVRSGDLLTRVDGTSLKGLPLDEAVATFCGPPGSAAAVTLRREGETEKHEVAVTRKIVRLTAYEYRVQDDVGLIKIKTFQLPSTYDWLKTTIEKSAAGPELKGYILDLRDNVGGLLDQAIKVAGAFLDSGDIIVVQDRKSVERKPASGHDLTGGKQVVVLINHNTASGAEIVASSLQDAHRAVIAGRRSFGAGTVQTLVPLDSQQSIKFTTAKLLRANGQPLEGKGVEPDVSVQESPGQQGDLDVASALEILHKPR
jgi:carboxyl-terminal processing protease